MDTNYLDFNDDIIGIDQPNGMTPTTAQPIATPSNKSTVAHQQSQPAKDLSDWRNIQLGATSTLFDPLWLPQTPVTPLSSSWNTSNNTPYPSPYNQSSSFQQHLYPSIHPNNHNQPWKMPAFPIGKVPSYLNFTHSNMMNHITDKTANPIVNPSTPIRFE